MLDVCLGMLFLGDMTWEIYAEYYQQKYCGWVCDKIPNVSHVDSGDQTVQKWLAQNAIILSVKDTGNIFKSIDHFSLIQSCHFLCSLKLSRMMGRPILKTSIFLKA